MVLDDLCSIDVNKSPRFILRWNVETTFQELRAHLGVETQRQWSDLAIARTEMFPFRIMHGTRSLKQPFLTLLALCDNTFGVRGIMRTHLDNMTLSYLPNDF